MILHLNALESGAVARSGPAIAALIGAIEATADPAMLAGLRLHLDWLQYRANFRDPFMVRRACDEAGRSVTLAEIAVDLRRLTPELASDALRGALETLARDDAGEPDDAVRLEDWTPLRDSIVWRFNDLFWKRLGDWEQATGRGFEAALPSGRSDAHQPDAIADSVAEFWTLLREIDKRGQLPAEIFALEIGVGTGGRAALWLDRFRALDEARATGYYPRLRFLLGDYAMPTLDRALTAVDAHRDLVSVIAMDALNPLKTLAFLRYKILNIHLTNVYDNLAVDELVRRDGRLYVVDVRARLPADAAARVAADFALTPDTLPGAVQRLLDVGPEALGDRARGAAFWRAVWDALRLDERLRALPSLAEAPLPPGLREQHLEDLLATAPDDVRFQVSWGAAQSFVNTLPLLHPRGYLQVQDIFVTSMGEYRMGFRGPGKLDGSVVNWVNGPLLRAVAARAGYDVHFAPFHYRPGSRTSTLYTTQRE
jgi:hypothetical protein